MTRVVLVEIGGRTRRVEIGGGEAGRIITIDGRTVVVDVARVGPWTSLRVGPPEGGPHDSGDEGPHDSGDEGPRDSGDADGVGAAFRRPSTSYEIAIDDRGGELVVHVNGVAIPVAVHDPRAAWRAHQHGTATVSGGDVRAPMPGRIVKVLVKPGDTVTARQGLVVVEAMKMENELRAPKDGRVADVRVKEGMSVEANAVLVTLE